MSQESAWTMEEMARAMREQRMAEAERYRRFTVAREPRPTPRMLLANLLRSLATLLDGEVGVQARPDRRLARAH